jgi:hypothetical protein
MVLTDNQIERYSRQIIVPGVGGNAQERLLASCVTIVAAAKDAAGALAYLAGAGVGRIAIQPTDESAAYDSLVARTGDLNSDVSVSLRGSETPDQCDLILALIGDAASAAATTHLWRAANGAAQSARRLGCAPAIIARLDPPGRIAILPAPPPCMFCADADLLSPHARGGNAGAIAMVAVVEAFRLLAGIAGQQPEPALLEFDGYVSRARALGRRRLRGDGQERCGCEVRA